MIKISVYRNERQECIGFKALGHAGFAESGQDIVCAAVSILTINTINAIERYAQDQTSLVSDDGDGLIEYRLVDEEPSDEAALLLDTMILGLETLAEDDEYKKYVDLTFEEV